MLSSCLLEMLCTEKEWSLLVSILLSVLGCFLTNKLIPPLQVYLYNANLRGKDMSKRDNDKFIPEALGLVSGFLFLLIMCVFLAVRFSPVMLRGGDFPQELLCKLAMGLLCVSFGLFLGFVDDVLNLPWRIKLVLPVIGSIPLLVPHHVYHKSTTIILPTLLHQHVGPFVDVGVLYYVYMILLAVFCTNAINIYAGVNGLEVGQSLVIAASIIVFNCIEIFQMQVMVEKHHLSLSILLPFIGTSLALYWHNRYPARVFVGDSFTYSAGMTFCVVGVLGFFSKTLLLFLLPQVINFLYSLPQLFKLLPCPRHRLPRYCRDSDQLQFSTITVPVDKVHPLVLRALPILVKMRLLYCHFTSKNAAHGNSDTVTINNMTLINWLLMMGGPMHEGALTRNLMILQVLSSMVGFVLRYPVGNYLYRKL